MDRILAGTVLRIAKVLGITIAVVAALNSCAIDYVSGQPSLVMISEEEEIAIGSQQDTLILAEYGLYDDPELSDLVDSLGQSLVDVSHRSDIEYNFRVLDNEMVNAFALPGGYIYFPRGILAFFNSDDQLAGVLAHEIGHVVARHGVEQMSQEALVTGFGFTKRLAATFPIIGGIVTAPINLGLLKYSRDQESESDRLGVEYTTRIGYDAATLADFFQTLGTLSSDSGNTVPTYLSTHPHPDDRYEEVLKLVAEWQEELSVTPAPPDRKAYLQRIDGIVYGRNPRQGFASNGMFYHPDMNFQFPVPMGWQLRNSASRIILIADDEGSAIQMIVSNHASAEEAADAFQLSENLAVTDRRQQTINDFPTVSLLSLYQDGRQRIIIRSQFVQLDNSILAFHGMAPERDYQVRGEVFESLFGDIGPIDDSQIRGVEPQRIYITQAPRSGDLSSILIELGIPGDQVKELAYLNGHRLDDRIDEGYWLKIVQ